MEENEDENNYGRRPDTGLTSLAPPVRCGDWAKKSDSDDYDNVYDLTEEDLIDIVEKQQEEDIEIQETNRTNQGTVELSAAPPAVRTSTPTSQNETKGNNWKTAICYSFVCIAIGFIIYGIWYAAHDDSSEDGSDDPISGSGSWVDPNTPQSARSIIGMKENRSLKLVFSDEFTSDNRQFADGMDTRWTSEDRPGVTNAGLQYYNSSHVKTSDGFLVIETTNQDASWVEHDENGTYLDSFTRHYVSGLVSTWNKFCFTSGIIEVSLQLPGRPNTGGLWPAFWMLGNLGRAHYFDSTEGVWPWSWDTCGKSEEAQRQLDGQKYNACRYSRGRGSPEIDIIEAQPGDFVVQYPNVSHINGSTYNTSLNRPMIVTSLQVAPGVDSSIRPKSPNFPEPGQWYATLYPMGGEEYGPGMNGMINNYWYGQPILDYTEIWQDGLSVSTPHNESFYEEQTVFRTEWQTGKDNGYIRWYWGDKFVHEINTKTLQSKPGASDTVPDIPYEAMYLILNTDVSPKWGWNSCNMSDPCIWKHPELCDYDGKLICTDCSDPKCVQCDSLKWFKEFCRDIEPKRPAKYKIDYVRIYQDENDPTHTVGCNPPGLETRNIIEDNWEKYTFDPGVNKQGPLREILHGGGSCKRIQDCGGSNQGDCVEGRCECSTNEKWTGPFCESPFIGEFATGKPPESY